MEKSETFNILFVKSAVLDISMMGLVAPCARETRSRSQPETMDATQRVME